MRSRASLWSLRGREPMRTGRPLGVKVVAGVIGYSTSDMMQPSQYLDGGVIMSWPDMFLD